eukprot:TRINITY_DN43897_c0_g1_i1.p1 TRINITY_DN43897_c0_g1~~TRINITY_DN43897_c0_g1_i1.p1  ORF type:complete len:226 (+),score=73.85 TRINITY_DN43897_c0_g1_i1:81-758(+)
MAAASRTGATLPPLEHHPSKFGWHTCPAEGRFARRQTKDREMREKSMIVNRREGFQRLECRRNPMEPLVDAAGWVPDCERLRSDPNKELQRERQEHAECKSNFWERRRAKRLQREADRWRALDARDARKQQRDERLVGTGRRNCGSVGYDLVSHRYGSSSDAAAAKHRDDCTEFLAKKRTKELFQRANASGYNIITGVSTAGFVKVPPTPDFGDVNLALPGNKYA